MSGRGISLLSSSCPSRRLGALAQGIKLMADLLVHGQRHARGEDLFSTTSSLSSSNWLSPAAVRPPAGRV